jgi:hypothetical protein
LLFGYFVRQVGAAQIAAALWQIAWGFPLILALSGARQLVRSMAWVRAVEGHQLGLGDALPAVITGDALGNLTPLGLFIGEPAKCILVRDRVPLMASLSAVAIENFFYSLSAALTIAAGALLLLATFPMPFDLQLVSLGLVGGMTLLFVAAWWIVRKEFALASGGIGWMARFGIGRRRIAGWQQILSSLEQRVYGFSRRNRGALAPIVTLELLYHVFGTAEIYATVWLLAGRPPGVIDAFVLESVNRAVNVVFRFVPFRLGVDEAGTALFANVLGMSTALGVTLAVVRKGRVLFWTATGVLLLVRRGLTVRSLIADAEQAARRPDATRA